jgi:hypothetical protein
MGDAMSGFDQLGSARVEHERVIIYQRSTGTDAGY